MCKQSSITRLSSVFSARLEFETCGLQPAKMNRRNAGGGDGERVLMRLIEARGSDGVVKACLSPDLTPFSG